MPQVAPYIPPKDADLANWADNFTTRLTAAPGLFGLLASDAAAVAAVVTPFLTAYTAAINPSTRTPVTIAAKDTDKIGMLSLVRQYAIQISLNAGVLTSDKIDIGVNPRTTTPAPITNPTTQPIVTIASAISLGHVIRFRDELSSPTVKSKPYGVTQLQLFASASATPIPYPTGLAFKSVLTKAPAIITWDPSDGGKVAYYAGRWQTRSGLVGPWGPIVSMTIPTAN